MTPVDSLESISIVLVKTSHPGNVGSVARAMKTMGLCDLRLVQPKHAAIAADPEAIALASGAADVLANSQVYASLPEALADCQRAYALSARLRELGPALQSPAQAAQEALSALPDGVRSAFVFGAERTGLSNEEVQRCNRQVYIPSNPAYNSLNLSQAVQIVCYALRVASEAAHAVPLAVPNPEKRDVHAPRLASVKAVDDLQAHWLEAMEAVDFLNPSKPKKLVQRLARLLGKAQLEQEEVDMLRGFFSDVIRVAQGRLYPHEQNKRKAD
ncbi:RNA methyltransferase [Limnobacter sp.]|uniref:RNA methyltransferase n=1 Tax=Limnobacter sp. TaxID=2003368 RepID=UPI0035183092